MDKSTELPDDYPALLTDLKRRIRESQWRASLSVNRELVLLYWHIGRETLIRQTRERWGAKVIDRLATDLKQAFPDRKGFSPRNLKYIRPFAEAWPDTAIVQQLSEYTLAKALSENYQGSLPTIEELESELGAVPNEE